MLLAILPNWNSLDSVRQAHSDLELAGLVFFALLVVAEAVAHNSEQEKRKHLFDSIGIWFFAIAVLCEIAGYWYGRQNDALSEQVIRSLDSTARDAAGNASTALSNSKEAETKSTDAVDKAGKALDKSNRANVSASKALNVSKAATDAAEKAQEKVEAVAEHADDIDRAVWQTQYWLNSLHVTEKGSLIKALKKFKGQKIDFVSYVGDPGGDIFCNELLNAAYSAGVDPTNRCGIEPAVAPRAGIIQMGLLVAGPDISETKELGSILANNTNCPAGSARAPAPKLTVLVGFHPPFIMDKRLVFKPPTRKQTNKPNTKP